MSKSSKLILLSLTLWPLIFGVAAVVFLWNLSLAETSRLPAAFSIASFVTVIILAISMFFYFFQLYNNPYIDNQSKLNWLIGIILTGTFAMVLYWKKYIW